MNKAIAILGNNWGDESKGKHVDYFAAKNPKAVVCRYCSGANAGHTVVTPEGKRHVFGHFGSGSFVGNPTHLSQFFISNPMLFRKEWHQLAELGVQPVVTVDPNSIVTTPYDMIINQMLEDLRCTKRHGSCGVGINETVVRSQDKRLRLTVSQLHNPFRLDFILKEVSKQEYFKRRMAEEGIPANATIPSKYETILLNPKVKTDFLEAVEFFNKNVVIVEDKPRLFNQDIIFEGAQGLLLDQDMIDYQPHVTSSKTGIHNVLKILAQLPAVQLEPVYVTRYYVTRHGAGPLPNETMPCNAWADNTNIPNQHQGLLRFGWLSSYFMLEQIKLDIGNLPFKIAISHLDQEYNLGNTIRSILEYLGTHIGYESYGPTRNDIARVAQLARAPNL